MYFLWEFHELNLSILLPVFMQGDLIIQYIFNEYWGKIVKSASGRVILSL